MRSIKSRLYCIKQRRRQDSVRGGDTFGGRPRGGSGGGPEAGELSKVFRKLLKKIAKMHYFSIFFKKFNKRR